VNETNEIKRREFLIGVKPERVTFLICKEWPRKFLGEKCFYKFFEIMP
jgi:hypothetical protein